MTTPSRHLPRRPFLTAALPALASAAAATSVVATSACGGRRPEPASAPSSSAPQPPAPSPSAEPRADAATPTTGTPFTAADWSLEEMVGQLVMVGVDSSAAGAPGGASRAGAAMRDLLTSRHVGGVFLAGRSGAGVEAVRALTDELTSLVATASTRGTPLLVATDQEGGDVQVLTGPGFSDIPSARRQGASGTESLTASAAAWGAELATAGINMNLAPVADLVDIADPAGNEPIGRWGREYGHNAAAVSGCAGAFAQGMRDAGVLPTFKHFPGLGRVTTNTDTSSGVTDSVTARADDAAVGVFADAISAGAEVIMVSSAVYSQIDPGAPAVFSPTVVTDMLRGDLGFTGVVITDDVAAASQLAPWPPAERAVLAVRAGCDLVLASADASVVPAMLDAMVAQAQNDDAFASLVATAAERVLTAKAALNGANEQAR